MSAVLDARYELVSGSAARPHEAPASTIVIDAKFKVVRRRKPLSPEAVLVPLAMCVAFGFGGLIPFVAHLMSH